MFLLLTSDKFIIGDEKVIHAKTRHVFALQVFLEMKMRTFCDFKEEKIHLFDNFMRIT
jgi:hypothetical protein